MSVIFPKKINCFISETRCEIKLQNLLDHTSKRIFQIPTVKINQENNYNSFEIFYKWGCDGSNGQSPYKQIYENPNICSDSDLFMFSIVPLQMHCLDNRNDKVVLWKNNRFSSTRFCRPIMFDFKKETVATTLLEVKAIEHQIEQMRTSIIFVNGNEISVTHKLVFTMVDGKVCNSMTGTSSQRCYICGSTPTQMNNINKLITFDINEESMRFGLSTLHAWIRFFECLLHISYRLEFKRWSVRTTEHKLQLSKTKKRIQDQFRMEMGLLVDIVVQGKGNTNDGNTARRFFRNPEKVVKSQELTYIYLNDLEIYYQHFPVDTILT
uniref:V(D)J recombination-activating protein 1 RNase H domain-containing protein n=1 Tax=Schizaphis graminum TaxID=13262 RepID=A0A2S2PFW3_SCHGA